MIYDIISRYKRCIIRYHYSKSNGLKQEMIQTKWSRNIPFNSHRPILLSLLLLLHYYYYFIAKGLLVCAARILSKAGQLAYQPKCLGIQGSFKFLWFFIQRVVSNHVTSWNPIPLSCPPNARWVFFGSLLPPYLDCKILKILLGTTYLVR